MATRSRGVRRWPDLWRVGFKARYLHSPQARRTFSLAMRCFELCLLGGILLAFAAGMMRIR